MRRNLLDVPAVVPSTLKQIQFAGRDLVPETAADVLELDR